MQIEVSQSIFFSKKYDNTLWIATPNIGVYKFNYRSNEFENYLPDPNDLSSSRNAVNYVFCCG